MPGDQGNIRYSIREPFDHAVDGICRSLAKHGLTIAGQLDISRRVERSLGIVLPPCTILFVLPGPSVLSLAAVHPWAATFLPLHVVISGKDAETEIEVESRVHAYPGDSIGLLTPVMEAQRRLREAMEAIAMRPSLVG